MARVRLVHWKEAELGERTARLVRAGHEVHGWGTVDGAAFLRSVADDLPDAVVIDLSRLPSHGREVGVALRSRKATRRVPLVFVDGSADKIARVQAVLPDAVFTSWRGIRGALLRAIEKPVAQPVRPATMMAAYAKTPLPRKLGIREGSSVALVGAPPDFERTLGPLPPGVRLRRDLRCRTDLTLFFARDARSLRAKLARMVPRAEAAGLWIVWPKKTSPLASDLTPSVVREAAMAAGLVDFKICAVDETWSGLRFTRRAL